MSPSCNNGDQERDRIQRHWTSRPGDIILHSRNQVLSNRNSCVQISLHSDYTFSTLHRWLHSMPTTLSGAHIGFLAAVWSTCLNVQVLSATLPLFWHHTNTRMCMMALCHFRMLRNALCSLEQIYDKELSNMMCPTQQFPALNFHTPFCIPASTHHQYNISDTYLTWTILNYSLLLSWPMTRRFVLSLSVTTPRMSHSVLQWMVHGHYGNNWGGLLSSDGFFPSLFWLWWYCQETRLPSTSMLSAWRCVWQKLWWRRTAVRDSSW